MSSRADLAKIDAEARRGDRPRHAMVQLAAMLGAEIVQPDAEGRPRLLDRAGARLVGDAGSWAAARALLARARAGDAIFATDEAIGLPLAALRGSGEGPRLLTFVHNVRRPRARAALRLFRAGRSTDRFMAVTSVQTDFLRHELGLSADRTLRLSDQTDLAFFTPGPPDPVARPVIMSVGLEQRDYRTLAAATADMNLDVRISGFSTDARALAGAFPPELPANMARGFYEWPDLLRLYRTASVVVVSLFPNRYAAGIQAMLEGIACERPVVVTRTEGLIDYLDRPDLVTSVPAGDPAALAAAIRTKLDDREGAARMAEAARAHFAPLIDSEAYCRQIAATLRAPAA